LNENNSGGLTSVREREGVQIQRAICKGHVCFWENVANAEDDAEAISKNEILKEVLLAVILSPIEIKVFSNKQEEQEEGHPR